jgi:hypothetical protein
MASADATTDIRETEQTCPIPPEAPATTVTVRDQPGKIPHNIVPFFNSLPALTILTTR